MQQMIHMTKSLLGSQLHQVAYHVTGLFYCTMVPNNHLVFPCLSSTSYHLFPLPICLWTPLTIMINFCFCWCFSTLGARFGDSNEKRGHTLLFNNSSSGLMPVVAYGILLYIKVSCGLFYDLHWVFCCHRVIRWGKRVFDSIALAKVQKGLWSNLGSIIWNHFFWQPKVGKRFVMYSQLLLLLPSKVASLLSALSEHLLSLVIAILLSLQNQCVNISLID